MATIRSFEELHCWQAGTEIRRELALIVRGFPEKEKYTLSNQVIRASRSVTNNIAEGFGRFHYQEFIKFCRIARGSLSEIKDHLIVACDEGYITSEKATQIRVKVDRCINLINGLIKYLKSRKDHDDGNLLEEPMIEYASN